MATHGVALLVACIFNVYVVCRDQVMFCYWNFWRVVSNLFSHLLFFYRCYSFVNTVICVYTVNDDFSGRKPGPGQLGADAGSDTEPVTAQAEAPGKF